MSVPKVVTDGDSGHVVAISSCRSRRAVCGRGGRLARRLRARLQNQDDVERLSFHRPALSRYLHFSKPRCPHLKSGDACRTPFLGVLGWYMTSAGCSASPGWDTVNINTQCCGACSSRPGNVALALEAFKVPLPPPLTFPRNAPHHA